MYSHYINILITNQFYAKLEKQVKKYLFILSAGFLLLLSSFSPKKVLADSCGAYPQPCCNPGEICDPGYTCGTFTYACERATGTTCGISGLNCCAGSAGATCNNGYTCDTTDSSNYVCVVTPTQPRTCENAGDVCCEGFACDNGLTCNDKTNVCGGTSTGTGTLTCTPTGGAAGTGINTAIGCIPVLNNDNGTAFATFVLKWAIGIGGGIAFLLILYGGFMVMTSAGNPERLKAGQELLTSAIFGLLLLIFSVFILNFIGIKILGIFS
jgi:hypothetical protein